MKLTKTKNEGQAATKQNIAQGIGSRSKETDSVATPEQLYKALDAEFNFKLDPCPLDWDPEKDESGLEIPWAKNGFTYVNPPYSCVEQWFAKAVAEMQRDAPSVFLVPYRGSNSYWDKYVWGKASEVRHFKNKIKFPGYNKQAPMSLCLVIFCRNYCRIEAPIVEMIGGYEFLSHPVPKPKTLNLCTESREYAKRLLEVNEKQAEIAIKRQKK